MFEKLKKEFSERLRKRKEKIYLLTKSGRIIQMKKQRNLDGTFTIFGHKYAPISDRSTHFFIEGYANEIEAVELLENSKKINLIGTNEFEAVVENSIFDTLALKRQRWFEKIETRLLLVGLIAVGSLALTFLAYQKINLLIQQLQAQKQLIVHLQEMLSENTTIVTPPIP